MILYIEIILLSMGNSASLNDKPIGKSIIGRIYQTNNIIYLVFHDNKKDNTQYYKIYNNTLNDDTDYDLTEGSFRLICNTGIKFMIKNIKTHEDWNMIGDVS